jgi:hypothetical protein
MKSGLWRQEKIWNVKIEKLKTAFRADQVAGPATGTTVAV